MEKKGRSKSIFVNTFSNYLHRILQVGIFLFLTPFIATQLGKDGYGLWSLIQASVAFLGLLDMGFSTSVVKYIADARGKDSDERLRSLTSTFFWLYTFLSIFLLAISVVLSLYLPKLLNLPPDKINAATAVFLIISVKTALGFPLGMFRGIMIGFQKQWWANLFKILATSLYGLGCFFALQHDASIERLAYASLFSSMIALIGGFFVSLRKLPGISIHPKFFQKSLLKEISEFSLYFFMIQISTLIYTRVDTLIIQAYLTLSHVALYTIATKASEHAAGLCRQLTHALTPIIAELKGAGEEKNIKAVFRLGTKLSTAMAAPLLIGLWEHDFRKRQSCVGYYLSQA